MSKPKKETLPEKQARLKAAAVLNAKSLYHYRLIADATGIEERTLHNWKKSDPEFFTALKVSRSEFINRNMKRAPPSFLLERLESDIFKERKEQDNTGDININIHKI